MNIHGRKTVDLAEELVLRSLPFLLVTGYAPVDDDPAVIKAAPRVQKPFSEHVLRTRMAEAFIPAPPTKAQLADRTKTPPR